MHTATSTELRAPKRVLRSSTKPTNASPGRRKQTSTITLQTTTLTTSLLHALPSLPQSFHEPCESSGATASPMRQIDHDSIAELEFDHEPQAGPSGSSSAEDEEDMAMEEDDHSTSQSDDHELGATSAFRQPSPSSTMIFESPENSNTHKAVASKYPVMSPYRLAHVAQSMDQLALAVLTVLAHYRQQLNHWESDPNPTDQVMCASALIDQCLFRLVMLLQPVHADIVQLIYTIVSTLQTLEDDVICDRLCLRNEVECTKFWSRLAHLADQVSRAEDQLTDLSTHLCDVHDWIDGCLTPVLGRLAVEEDHAANVTEDASQRRNPAVSQLLDIQSYFCQAVDQISWATKLYRKLLTKTAECIEEFCNSMVCQASFVDELLNWGRLSRVALKVIADSLLVLASVARGIESLTAGTSHELQLSSIT